jgi:hypothetical protein
MAHVNGQSEGLLLRGWHRLFGRRAAQLTEAERPRSFLAYVLMGTQGAALVLVFGHTEIHWLEAGNPVMFGIVGLSLFVLVATAIAAQNCAIACMRRVGILMRNGAYGAAFEHVAYIVFVLLVEILTYGIAIYVLETNPQALLSDTPIIPFGVTGMIATIALRAAYIGWTEVQLQIVSAPLPPQWETFLERGKAMIGGHGQAILESMHLSSTDLAAVARAFAEMSKPAVKRKTWWNGWLLKRDEEYRTALDEQARRVSEQLLEVGGNRIAELEFEKAALVVRANEQIRAAETAAHDRAIDMTSRAITAVIAGAELPNWLLEARPELANITLAKRPVSRSRAAGNGEVSALKSPAERMRFFLQSLGITPAKHRGTWIASSDIPALIGDANPPETPTELAKKLGNKTMEGTAYIAPLDKVMERLLAYHCVPDTIAKAWANVPQSSGDSSGDSDDKGAVIDLDSRRQSQA